jgi:hypothetical protein
MLDVNLGPVTANGGGGELVDLISRGSRRLPSASIRE